MPPYPEDQLDVPPGSQQGVHSNHLFDGANRSDIYIEWQKSEATPGGWHRAPSIYPSKSDSSGIRAAYRITGCEPHSSLVIESTESGPHYRSGALVGRFGDVSNVFKQASVKVFGTTEGDCYSQIKDSLRKEGLHWVTDHNFLFREVDEVAPDTEDRYELDSSGVSADVVGWFYLQKLVKSGDVEYVKKYAQAGSSDDKMGTLRALLSYGTTLDNTSRDRLKAPFQHYSPPPGPFPSRTQCLSDPRKTFVRAKEHGVDDRVLEVPSPYTKVLHKLYTLYSEVEKALEEGKRSDGPAIPIDQFEIYEVYPTIIEQCKGVKGLGKAISWAELPVREREVARINKMNITAADASS
ncbi:hypothetical protein PQX77_015181 [Marasmius sp. AFHP31]|nr:hypothetical protein PQX77_015181 [Marasmius sp. AFHP31]